MSFTLFKWPRSPRHPGRARRSVRHARGASRSRRTAIVDAALAVLDADGLELLSMRHVARTLNTTAAALYWHVGSKDGLLDLVFDRVIGEQPVPDPDPERWQEQVRDVARTMRRTILGHRDVVRLSIGRIPLGPNALRYADRVLGHPPRRRASRPARGGRPAAPDVGRDRLRDRRDGRGGQPPADRPPPGTEGEMIRGYLGSLPGEQFPNLVAVADHMAAADPDARFELLLDFFVDGLAQRAI